MSSLICVDHESFRLMTTKAQSHEEFLGDFVPLWSFQDQIFAKE